MSVYAFREGPVYRGASQVEQFDAALTEPLGIATTLFDQAKGGALSSFGLGTAIRDVAIPAGNTSELSASDRFGRAVSSVVSPGTSLYANVRRLFGEETPSLSEDAYRSSAYFRDNIPYDAGMTEPRAAALAAFSDAKKVREFYAAKRPITAFLGSLAGQAVDPINYIPIAGPAVKAAAVARAGKIRGAAVTSAFDAAANTAIASVATSGSRERYGDDVSWQSTISEIATAALIGGAFGTIGGALGARRDARLEVEASQRLTTLKTTQEARVALNEAIDAVSRGEPVDLSPNATEPVARAVESLNPVRHPDFLAPITREDLYRSTAVGRIVDGRPPELQSFETFARNQVLSENPELATRYASIEKKFQQAQEKLAAIEEPLASRQQSDAVRLIDPATADRLQAIEAEISAKPPAKRIAALEAERSVIVESIGPDAISKAESNFRIGPTKQSKAARSSLATARQEFAKVRRETDALVNRSAVVSGLQSRVDVNNSVAAPETIPEGRAQAETRIAKPDDIKAIAEQYGVDPNTGAFAEQADLKQLSDEGRLTADDQAEVAAADATFKNSDAYAKALDAAVGCLI